LKNLGRKQTAYSGKNGDNIKTGLKVENSAYADWIQAAQGGSRGRVPVHTIIITVIPERARTFLTSYSTITFFALW
jgi:hypothetical protein